MLKLKLNLSRVIKFITSLFLPLSQTYSKKSGESAFPHNTWESQSQRTLRKLCTFNGDMSHKTDDVNALCESPWNDVSDLKTIPSEFDRFWFCTHVVDGKPKIQGQQPRKRVFLRSKQQMLVVRTGKVFFWKPIPLLSNLRFGDECRRGGPVILQAPDSRLWRVIVGKSRGLLPISVDLEVGLLLFSPFGNTGGSSDVERMFGFWCRASGISMDEPSRWFTKSRTNLTCLGMKTISVDDRKAFNRYRVSSLSMVLCKADQTWYKFAMIFCVPLIQYVKMNATFLELGCVSEESYYFWNLK